MVLKKGEIERGKLVVTAAVCRMLFLNEPSVVDDLVLQQVLCS